MTTDPDKIERSCESKRAYVELRHADIAAKCARKRGQPVRVYHCQFCGCFHLTSDVYAKFEKRSR